MIHTIEASTQEFAPIWNLQGRFKILWLYHAWLTLCDSSEDLLDSLEHELTLLHSSRAFGSTYSRAKCGSEDHFNAGSAEPTAPISEDDVGHWRINWEVSLLFERRRRRPLEVFRMVWVKCRVEERGHSVEWDISVMAAYIAKCRFTFRRQRAASVSMDGVCKGGTFGTCKNTCALDCNQQVGCDGIQ